MLRDAQSVPRDTQSPARCSVPRDATTRGGRSGWSEAGFRAVVRLPRLGSFAYVGAMTIVERVERPKNTLRRGVAALVVASLATALAGCDSAPPKAPALPAPPAASAATADATSANAPADPHAAPATGCKEIADMSKLPGEPVTGEWVTTPSCLRYTVLRPGTGKQPQSRLSSVRAHYTGWLTDGTEFDSSVARGKPFDFRLSQVVPGWTEAMLGMKAGEKRKLVIPYKLAYGREGHGNIPPKATLVFDVELIDVLVE